jgi:hypothetical protein
MLEDKTRFVLSGDTVSKKSKGSVERDRERILMMIAVRLPKYPRYHLRC